jgi:phosphotransferase system enzyme I (PtsI)
LKILQGIPVSPGVAIAPAMAVDREEMEIRNIRIFRGQPAEEVARLEKGIEATERFLREQLQGLPDAVQNEIGLIFEGHIQLLRDPKIIEPVREEILSKKYTAEYAVRRGFHQYVRFFREHDNPALARMADDIQDVERRLLRILLGDRRELLSTISEPVIIVARDLSPSQTASLPRDKVRGFLTDVGGSTSHTAILARALGIPAIVGLHSITDVANSGEMIAMDGKTGRVIINPDGDTITRLTALGVSYKEADAKIATEVAGRDAVTADGETFELRANIEFPEEIPAAMVHGAMGIGLYRTEFLYTGRTTHPSEEDHYAAYRKAIKMLDGKPLTIRTFDLGSDKFAEEAGVTKWNEPNPFLGCRSTRLSLERPELFVPQLRAIYRAALEGPVEILLPMITSVDELLRVKSVIDDAHDDLTSAGVPFKRDVPLGVMIEVPAAAMTADALAKECDFFSIGTNDLTQYTLAVDRGNDRIASLYQPAHPAVLRLIREVCEAGARHGKWVTVCGELANSGPFVPLLYAMGLRKLSMTPSAIAMVKKIMLGLTKAMVSPLLDLVTGSSTTQQVKQGLGAFYKQHFPELD